MLIIINNKQSVAYIKGEPTEPYDVLCRDCKQLRISFVVSDKCGNCGSTNIIKGKVGQLERSQANGKEARTTDREQARETED